MSPSLRWEEKIGCLAAPMTARAGSPFIRRCSAPVGSSASVTCGSTCATSLGSSAAAGQSPASTSCYRNPGSPLANHSPSPPPNPPLHIPPFPARCGWLGGYVLGAQLGGEGSSLPE